MKPTRVRLTAGRVADFTCPADKTQVFLWDTDTPTLALRVTPTGRKTYIFEARLKGSTIRINIGTVADWPIEKARTKAQGLKVLIDSGTDPRELERQQQQAKDQAIADKVAADAAQVQQDAALALTVGAVWQAYIEQRRPHWGELHYRDHIRKGQAGGEPFKRGTGMTEAGPLFPLMTMPLCELTAPVIEAWAAREAQTRPTSARLAWRCLKVFLGWCEEQPEYVDLMPPKNQAKTKKTREALGKAGVKSDSLQREQLPVWFEAVRNISNPVISAYLQTMLLTGARPGEIIAMRWDDVNTQWKGLTIRDKVEGERVIPLTPFVAQLLATLPRRNEWVFSSPNSNKGHLTEPNHPHSIACKVAGLDGLTLHGLRRSFKSLTEWLEIPAGVVAQLMGHKPSATAEKHYTVRPLDLLRVHHEKIEAWILEQADVQFDRTAEPGKLRVVAG